MAGPSGVRRGHETTSELQRGRVVLKIVIWDNDPRRIAEIDRNLQAAAAKLGLKVLILSNAEPPLIARENLLDRLPVLEIAGRHWSRRPGHAFSRADCVDLLSKFI